MEEIPVTDGLGVGVAVGVTVLLLLVFEKLLRIETRWLKIGSDRKYEGN